MKKTLIVLILAGILMFGFNTKAQEDAGAAINQDINISSAELGVSDPKILPTSSLYFLKNISRFFQGALTFNPLEKAKLSLRFANEKLLEAKKLAERKNISPEVLTNTLQSYNREIKEIKKRFEVISEKTPATENLLNKIIDSGIKQQKILDKISDDFPPAKKTVEQIKEKVLETIIIAPLKMETADEFGQRLAQIINQQPGSRFKDFKNLEILKEVELKVPEQVKDAIQEVQNNTLRHLSETLTNLNETEKTEFENYAKKIPGSTPRQIQILNNLNQTAITSPVKELVNKIQRETVEQLQIRIQKETEAGTTAEINEEKSRWMVETANEAIAKLQKIIETSAVTADQFPAIFQLRDNAKKHFDDAQKALTEKKFGAAWGSANAALQNIQNALHIFEIRPEIILEPPEVATTTIRRPQPPPPSIFYCIQLWQPVCGVDGKTYSNSCYARVANVKIAHEGECEKKKRNQEKVEEMMKKAWETIQELETAIGKLISEPAPTGGPETSIKSLPVTNSANSAVIVADRLKQAQRLLDEAKNHYQIAKESLLTGRFSEAYMQAEVALRLAKEGLTLLSRPRLPAPTIKPQPPTITPTLLTPTPTLRELTPMKCGGNGNTRQGCPAGYMCVYPENNPNAPSGICIPLIIKPTLPPITPPIEKDCLSYTPPICKDNEKPISPGVDANNCPLPPKCIPYDQISL